MISETFLLTCSHDRPHDKEHPHCNPLQRRQEQAPPLQNGVNHFILQRNQEQNQQGIEHGEPGRRELKKKKKHTYYTTTSLIMMKIVTFIPHQNCKYKIRSSVTWQSRSPSTFTASHQVSWGCLMVFINKLLNCFLPIHCLSHRVTEHNK